MTSKVENSNGDRVNIDNNSYSGNINDLDSIDAELFPTGFDTSIIHQKPYIVKLKNFLTNEEIDTVIQMADGKFNRSTIVVDDKLVHSSTRTSVTAFITPCGHRGKSNSEIENVLKKVCHLAGCTRKQVEGIMVVKYNKGDQYYNHHDYFFPEHVDVLRNGGQRIATFFCYLNDLEENVGGETEFPDIGVKSSPEKGSALFWWNAKPSGEAIEETLHRGNPVKSGQKLGLNIWIRENGW